MITIIYYTELLVLYIMILYIILLILYIIELQFNEPLSSAVAYQVIVARRVKEFYRFFKENNFEG